MLNNNIILKIFNGLLLLVLPLTFSNAGCSNSSLFTDSLSLKDSLAPESVTLGATAPLVKSLELSSLALKPDPLINGLKPGDPPSSPGANTITQDSANSLIPSGSLPVQSVTPPSTGFTIENRVYNATSGYDVYMFLSAFFPSGAVPAYSVESPYSQFIPYSPYFIVSTAGILSAGNFIVKASASNGGSGAYMMSNPVPVSVYSVQRVSSILADTESDAPSDYIVYNNKLYFSANMNVSSWKKLFCYDGSEITRISNVFSDVSNNANGSDAISNLCVLHGRLYFTADRNSINKQKLYYYDGSSIVQVSDLDYDPDDGWLIDDVRNVTVHDNKIFFTARNNYSIYKLYCYDGTLLYRVSDTSGNAYITDDPGNLYSFNGYLYFTSSNDLDNVRIKLYRYDGTTVSQVANTSGNNSISDFTSDLTGYNGSLYFFSMNSLGYSKLYAYDGSTVRQITDILPGSTDFPKNLRVCNGKLYFTANSGSGFKSLYSYDGTTVRREINSSNGYDDNPENLMVHDDQLFFSASTTSNSSFKKLFKLSNDTLQQVTDIRIGDTDDPKPLLSTQDGLYFYARCTGGGVKLYLFNDSNAFMISNTTKSLMKDDIIINPYYKITEYGGALYCSMNEEVNTKPKIYRIQK